MASRGGARALGLEGEVGSLEAGKRADVTVVELGRLHTTPQPDVVSTLVYAAEARDVRDVLIDGRVVLRDGELQTLEEREVVAEAARQYGLLAARSGV
jgi:5-methylthioadenosine/S-adenosylhomocysteine deaminase